MFVREKKNSSGSVSIQIVSKNKGRYKVVKTIGCATERHEIDRLKLKARQKMEELKNQPSLFASVDDQLVEQAFSSLSNSHIQTVGPELIFGKIYDYIGFGVIQEPLFRHLVVARLAFPLSKLKTTEYLYRYQGVQISTDKIYRFLDKLNHRLKKQIEQIAFAYTKHILKDDLSVVFYDMTTLYFEAEDEDDLRKMGFSKDGKHSNPQIVIGLLVGLSGYPIGNDVFEGNCLFQSKSIPVFHSKSIPFNLIMQSILISFCGTAKGNQNAFCCFFIFFPLHTPSFS